MGPGRLILNFETKKIENNLTKTDFLFEGEIENQDSIIKTSYDHLKLVLSEGVSYPKSGLNNLSRFLAFKAPLS